MSYRLVRWTAAMVIVAGLISIPVVVLARPYLGAVLGYTCGERANFLTDLHSVNDLQARFNADTGHPRLILLVSPT
jgi:hypothetical protein